MKVRKLPDVAILRRHLDYDPATGIFIRKIDGCLAGCINKSGYRQIMVDGQIWLAHRLAYCMFYGKTLATIVSTTLIATAQITVLKIFVVFELLKTHAISEGLANMLLMKTVLAVG